MPVKTVDEYIEKLDRWRDEVVGLREILRSTELEETVKWGAPCYVLDGAHVVGIAAFKNHFALWFHQGALLEDPQRVLINAQEGKTQALRQWRFDSSEQIDASVIRVYVEEAIQLERAGKRVPIERSREFELAPLLAESIAADPELETAFEGLTPGRRREYSEYIAEAKRAETREKRLAKILPMIRAGRGLNDRYRK